MKFARQLDRPFQSDIRWRELHFGAWENRTWDEIRDSDRAAFEQWSLHFHRDRPTGGESFPELLQRVQAATDALPADRSVLVITHAGCLRALACALEIVPAERIFDWEAPYGALFTLDPGQRLLTRLPAGKPEPAPAC